MTATAEQRWAAASAHLSALVVAAGAAVAISGPLLLALVAAPLGPLAVAVLSRRAGLFVRGHVREALRFTLSLAFSAVGVALGLIASVRVDALTGAYWPLLFVALLLVWLWACFLVMAAARALRGREWRYPFVIGRRRRRGG